MPPVRQARQAPSGDPREKGEKNWGSRKRKGAAFEHFTPRGDTSAASAVSREDGRRKARAKKSRAPAPFGSPPPPLCVLPRSHLHGQEEPAETQLDRLRQEHHSRRRVRVAPRGEPSSERPLTERRAQTPRSRTDRHPDVASITIVHSRSARGLPFRNNTVALPLNTAEQWLNPFDPNGSMLKPSKSKEMFRKRRRGRACYPVRTAREGTADL